MRTSPVRRVTIAVGVLWSCLALAQSQKLVIPAVPGELPRPQGLLVDNYDGGTFFGTFKDTKGSTITGLVATAPGGTNGFLLASYDMVQGGYVGLWHKVGMQWNGGQQNWAEGRELQFLAYVDKPLDLTLTIKGANNMKWVAKARLEDAGKWRLVSLPCKDWENIASGLGAVSDIDISLAGAGKGVLAIDEVRILGAKEAKAQAQAIELDPKVIFAKCVIPSGRSNKTYIVSVDGNDATGDGSQAKPLRTIQHAATLVLPGDTALIRSGTYAEEHEPGQRGVVVSRSGAPDAWITFKAYPGERPVITSPTWATLEVRDAAYIEISGLEVTTTTNAKEQKNVGVGISATRAHHVRVVGNVTRDCGQSGISTAYCDYVTVEGNRVFGNSFYSIYNGSGISLWEGRDFDKEPGLHNVIRGNTCYANENKGPTPLYGGELTDGNGIIIDWNRGTFQTLIENNLCYNNGGRGIQITHSNNILARNNTIWGNGYTKGDPGTRATYSDAVLFVNNIIVGRDGQKFTPEWKPGPSVAYHHNMVFNYTTIEEPLLTGTASNLLNLDPRFRAASADPAAADFHLGSSSPAIDAGDAECLAGSDLEGKKRPSGQRPDMGCYER